MTIEERFWGKVDKSAGPDGCWPWAEGRCGSGYGKFRYATKGYASHRLAYEIQHGPIPEGLCVLHRCDNPPCCNPAHLFAGTHADNMKDRNSKGRQARGDKVASRLYPGIRKGTLNGRARLTESTVVLIRAEYANGATLVELAQQHGVSFSAVSRLVRRETWAHVH
jgi:hypothetical protein